jgi:hypothetical protein
MPPESVKWLWFRLPVYIRAGTGDAYRGEAGVITRKAGQPHELVSGRVRQAGNAQALSGAWGET